MHSVVGTQSKQLKLILMCFSNYRWDPLAMMATIHVCGWWLDSIELGDHTKAFLVWLHIRWTCWKNLGELNINVSWSVNDTLSTLDDSYHRWSNCFFLHSWASSKDLWLCLLFWIYVSLDSSQAPQSFSFEVLEWGTRGLSGCFTLFQETSQAALGLPF